MLRVTGKITAVDSRGGTAKSGNPWQSNEYSILVADRSIATVSKFVDLQDPNAVEPKRGEVVDWAVQIEQFGSRTTVAYVAPWEQYTTE